MFALDLRRNLKLACIMEHKPDTRKISSNMYHWTEIITLHHDIFSELITFDVM